MKPNILVVEDQTSIRKLIVNQLSCLDAAVHEAEHGLEALEILRNGKKFDMILTDISMPEMNGYELCRKVKSCENLRKIPVVLISVFDSEEAIEKGFDSGANAFIAKTDLREQLEIVTAKILERSRNFQKKKILVVDRSKVVTRIIKDYLIQSGFKVSCVGNSSDAMKRLEKEHYDLILLDLKAAESCEVHLCHRLREKQNLRSIPVIIMNSSADRNLTRKWMHEGVAGFINKPFHPEELIVLLDRIFSEQYQLLVKENEMLSLERDMLLSSITSLANALEARDAYTRGHSESVAHIVKGMAEQAGISGEDLKTLEIAARLHDIGKIGISDKVLLKKGRLSAQEFDHIKEHPGIGARILENANVFKNILPTVLHHHEHYDGSGYPHGLKGEEIPFWARMTAVADAFDAMTSDRPYRHSKPISKAIDTIKEISGTQLCPKCVSLFLKWVEKEGGVEEMSPESDETERYPTSLASAGEKLFPPHHS